MNLMLVKENMLQKGDYFFLLRSLNFKLLKNYEIEIHPEFSITFKNTTLKKKSLLKKHVLF